MEQVMAGQLTTRFIQQTLKRNIFLGKPPLQRSSTQV
jgi:hypothetical protein